MTNTAIKKVKKNKYVGLVVDQEMYAELLELVNSEGESSISREVRLAIRERINAKKSQ